METKSISLIEGETFYYSNSSNFGVGEIKIEPQKKIFNPFNPFSSNQQISFSNTIMIPTIANELNTSKEKEKLNHSPKKDNTRIKTESSKDENNTMSIEKQSTKLLIKNGIDINEDNESNNHLSKNPYFIGNKNTFEFVKENNNTEIETKKVKKILMRSPEKIKKNKHHRRQSCNLINENMIKNNIKRMESYDIFKLKEKKNLKNKIKNKVSFGNTDKKICNIKLSDKNLLIKNYNNVLSPHRRKRGKTFVNRPSLCTDKKTQEPHKYNKRGTIMYKGSSHKFLLMGLNIGNNCDNKLSKIYEEKEEQEKNNNSINKKYTKKHDDLNYNNTKIKKVKTSINHYNNIILNNSPKKNGVKDSKSIKNIDFESALKSKKNLSKTQFNLFSPDKFTNTEFCDSDYCEYTLNCIDLIINGKASKKQEKSKVNFNFPKSKGNIKKRIALFDLDETLVHCTGDINISTEPYQYCIDIILPGNKETKVGINIRPLWKKTLNLIRKHYHIVVFTASHQAYADAVLNFMDPSNKYFKYRLYRNNCSLVDIDGVKFYVKDLDIFNEYYDLKDIIIVDNSVLSFIYHFSNGIPIVPYYNEDKDGSLYVVGLYLMHIFKEDDLREANKKYINLESFLNEAKTRQDSENSNNQELIDINKENNSNNECNKDKNNNKNNIIDKEKEKEINNNRANNRRCTYSIVNTKYKLISNSKLINMYYEIKNKNRQISDKNINDIVEENSNKSFSVENEEEIKENEENEKNIEELFFRKKLLTTGDEPSKTKVNNKSGKNLNNYFDVKMIRSNFYNSFSKQCI